MPVVTITVPPRLPLLVDVSCDIAAEAASLLCHNMSVIVWHMRLVCAGGPSVALSVHRCTVHPELATATKGNIADI
jgi:hypothetical protein